MNYYLIVGEASGDLHASHLMNALKKADPEAQFRFFGGDLMAAEGGTLVKHYRELAYMGFVPVITHLPTIFRNMAFCKRDIVAWQPDVVILVDYPGFNLNIAKYLREKTKIPAFYYISPKLWAWKEYRIKNIRRDVSELFSILPFEVPFFEKKHHYPIHYVGNPTAAEVRLFRETHHEEHDEFVARINNDKNNDNGTGGPFSRKLDQRPIIAVLAGSRKQEIKDNLPDMLRAVEPFGDYQAVVAGAPGIDDSFYTPFLSNPDVRIVRNQTYALLQQSAAALVTSGTATLETCLFGVPQVVCYKTPVPRLIRFAFNHIIKCRFISLVNLIADEEVVPELLADRFSADSIRRSLADILPQQPKRHQMLKAYQRVRELLGTKNAPDEAARLMTQLLRKQQQKA